MSNIHNRLWSPVQCPTWWFNVQHSILITDNRINVLSNTVYPTLVLIINLIPKWCHVDSDHYLTLKSSLTLGLSRLSPASDFSPVHRQLQRRLETWPGDCRATPTFNFLTWRILICFSVYIFVTLILRLGLIWFPVTSVPQYRLNVRCWYLMVGSMNLLAWCQCPSC